MSYILELIELDRIVLVTIYWYWYFSSVSTREGFVSSRALTVKDCLRLLGEQSSHWLIIYDVIDEQRFHWCSPRALR